MNEHWARWEKQVVNGVFPLRRSLRTSDHSAVFLTEHKSKAIPDALLKLVPAIPTLKQAQLAQWSMASRLSHPCLVRLLDTGTCQLDGLQFLFVVTEYAEQTLAQILAQRALEPGELRKLVRPILEALSFLHRKQLVHGGLKPSNLLMFKERPKLASDVVRPAGESTASIAPPSVFEPPESRDGSFSSAGDVWSLGVLIVEALTQKRPIWSEKSSSAVLPSTLPEAFVDIVKRCLSRNPANRPSVEELDAQINPMPPVYRVPTVPAMRATPPVGFVSPPVLRAPPVVYPERAVSAQSVASSEPDFYADTVVLSEPVIINEPAPLREPAPFTQPAPLREPASLQELTSLRGSATVGDSTPLRVPGDLRELVAQVVPDPKVHGRRSAKRTSYLTGAALIVTGVIAAAWGGAVFLTAQKPALPATPKSARVQEVVTTVSRPAAAEPPAPVEVAAANDPNSPVHEELPDVPDTAIATIHGRMLFAVRVAVDPAGNVFHATAVGRKASPYFARLSVEAAMRWKFAPADGIAPRRRLLHFEFTRAGVAVLHAT